MATTITKRVPSGPAANNTGRVARGTIADARFDSWGGSWGTSWGTSWFARGTSTALGITKRVPSGAVASNTKRVSI